MKNIFKEFNATGPNQIDTDIVIKNWDDRFSIIGYKEDNGEIKYTLNINRKNTRHTIRKTELFKIDALHLITILDLVCIQSATFRRGTTYITKQFAKSEFERFSKMYEEDLFRLNHLAGIKQSYNI